MTEDYLNELKRNYSDLVNKKQELLELKETIKKYEEKKEIKEYLALKEKFFNLDTSIVDISNDDLFEIAIGKCRVDNNTGNIYVYLGSFKYSSEEDVVHPSRDTRVLFNCDIDEIDYKVYKNIEGNHLDEVVIPKDSCEKFEKENIIIYPNTILNGEYYYKLRKMYYKDAIENGIDVAKEKLLTKERSNYNRMNKK